MRSVLLTFERGTVGTERERRVGVSCACPPAYGSQDSVVPSEPLDIGVECFIRQSLVGSAIHQCVVWFGVIAYVLSVSAPSIRLRRGVRVWGNPGQDPGRHPGIRPPDQGRGWAG